MATFFFFLLGPITRLLQPSLQIDNSKEFFPASSSTLLNELSGMFTAEISGCINPVASNGLSLSTTAIT